MAKVSKEYREVQRHARALLSSLDKLLKVRRLHEIPDTANVNCLAEHLVFICNDTKRGRPTKPAKEKPMNWLAYGPKRSGAPKEWTPARRRALVQLIDTQKELISQERPGRVTNKEALQRLLAAPQRHNTPSYLLAKGEKTIYNQITLARKEARKNEAKKLTDGQEGLKLLLDVLQRLRCA